MLGVVGKAIHEGLISFILQYIGTKEMVNDVNSVVVPVCGFFHPKMRISRGGEGGSQGLDMIWCWYIQDYNSLEHRFSTVNRALKWENLTFVFSCSPMQSSGFTVLCTFAPVPSSTVNVTVSPRTTLPLNGP